MFQKAMAVAEAAAGGICSNEAFSARGGIDHEGILSFLDFFMAGFIDIIP